MAIRDWFKRSAREGYAKREVTSVVAKLIPMWLANRALPANDDFETLCELGYRRNVVAYSCVRIKATSFAEPRLIGATRQAGDPEPVSFDHDLQRLLDEPNPDQDQYEFLEMLGMHYEIAGEFFVHKVRSKMGRVVQLWPLTPDRIKPIPDSTGVVVAYEFTVGGTNKRMLPAEDVLHNCMPDPVNEYRGLSPITVAARIADMDNNASDFLRALFLNGGAPLGLLKVKGTVPDSERLKIQQKWQEKYGGVKGWHSIAVLDEDAEYQQIGSKPNDLDLSAVFDVTEARLCQAWQVPPILVAARIGINRATYSNYASARRSFWDDTMSAIQRRGAAAFTRGIAREFGQNLICHWDKSNVAALQENQDTLWTRALLGWNGGLMTLNEARVMVRLPRIIDGDIRKSDLAGMGLDEAVAFEPSQTQGLRIPKELRELAAELHLALPDLRKVVDRSDPEDMKDAA